MIIYRNQSRQCCTRDLLGSFEKKLRHGSSHEQIVDLLIEFGAIESAILDGAFPVEDEDTELARLLRRGATLLGRAFIAATRGEAYRRWLSLLPPLLSGLAAIEPRPSGSGPLLPKTVSLSTPEGYAYYGLYPEMYLEAARRFLRERGPQPVTIVGIRSIGTSLSAVVAAALDGQDVWSFTVRPRGHPFDRRAALGSGIASGVESRAASPFLIVDEGPGLSGSSFSSIASALIELGVKERQIVLFPSWPGDPARFASQSASRQWPRYAKFLAGFEEVLPQEGRTDLSGGIWRSVLFSSRADWPAVQGQHERRKYLDAPANRLWKFAGLGSFGKKTWLLARELDEAGFIPKPCELHNGFLVSEFVSGRPLRQSDLTGELLERFLAYLRFRRRLLAASRTPFNEIHRFLQVNCNELIGRPSPDLERWRPLFEGTPACKVDGRMLPHEWLATDRGYVKADALDHHDDHFLPGCVDIAWDVAATCVEWRLEPDARAFLIGGLSDDPGLASRLPFYELAYLAFRGAYASMAVGALGECEDSVRFRALEATYKAELSRKLARFERIVA